MYMEAFAGSKIHVPVARPVPVWALLVLSLTGGLILGVATMSARLLLPGAPGWIANPGTVCAVWAAAAFAVGAVGCGHRWWTCALAGGLTQAGAVVGCHVGAAILLCGGQVLHAPLVWGAVGLVHGPLLGVAGAWWCGSSGWWRAGAGALLGAAPGAAGAFELLHRADLPSAPGTVWAHVLLGLAAPLLLPGGRADRLRSLAVLAALVPLGAGLHLLAGAVAAPV
ncbi:hypothetical protein GCM10009551_029980 [Nocardiopsis tropica]